MLDLKVFTEEIKATYHGTSQGKVIGSQGIIVKATIPNVAIGDICLIHSRSRKKLKAQVVSFDREIVMLAPFGKLDGVIPGSLVEYNGEVPQINFSDDLQGQVLDALGNPLNGVIQTSSKSISLNNESPNPLKRKEISEILQTGISAIDGLCTLGHGQRIGLFSGPGVGKSTLLGMIARNADVDVTVIALIGERGREVNEFIQESLGEEGLKKSILVISTSDESSLRRSTAIYTATAIAEHYRKQGKRVLLLVDSLTRVARAIREVGLSAGDIPVRQGYTASVFAELPQIIERTGTDENGSITAIYTILSSEEDELDPLGEEVKSLLDGHIVLKKSIAQKGIRPAIDPLSSVSRLITRLQPRDYLESVQTILKILATIKQERDLMLLGGTPSPELQAALVAEKHLSEMLNQSPSEFLSFELITESLTEIAEGYNKMLQQLDNRDAI